jgi:HEAT repeat protein
MQQISDRSDAASTERLVGFLHDADSDVRSRAMQLLSRDGSQRAQDAILAAAHEGSSSDRAAAVGAFDQLDDPRASQQLPQLISDSDPSVAMAAIESADNAGPEVDPALVRIVEDGNASQDLRRSAAMMLLRRGTELDATAQGVVEGFEASVHAECDDCEEAE